ncbi:hypothetical protein B0O80DRAFT_15396 [Mortierella sp. GBAus27b]|nr:hypothetical protein B0O80DRAFT_15396 [Mortierella sp. GBAus27b]
MPVSVQTIQMTSMVTDECVSNPSGTSAPESYPGLENNQQVVSAMPTEDFNAEAVIAAARRRLGLPYSWGGGHKPNPGPSYGTCVGYSGSIQPCPADKTVGFDCSGLIRDVMYQGIGIDLAHGGTANDQFKDPHSRSIRYEDRQPGDIEFFGTPERKTHVVLYIGKNDQGQDMMIEAKETGTNVHEVPLRTGGVWVRVRK